jgi:hypothetical protein
MLVNGEKLTPTRKIIPIPREGREDVVFIALPIKDKTERDMLLKKPVPPTIKYKDGTAGIDLTDKAYLKQSDEYLERCIDWMYLKSLESSPGIQWETVKMGDPTTWGNFRKELQDSHFNDQEILSILNGVIEVNGLDEEKVKLARESFLAREASQNVSNLKTVEQ